MKRPVFLNEDELDARLGTKAKLASSGNYGLGCLLFEGDMVRERGMLLDDGHFEELRAGFEEIGTFVIDGDLRAEQIFISDRLFCLIVTGSLVADELSIFETETLVFKDLTVRMLRDHDRYLKVLGRSEIGG
jgi:hypothetical protein